MESHEATFEIQTKTDAFAVERLLEKVHDSMREESRTLGQGTGDRSDMLADFASLRDAAAGHSPGRLTVRYERADESFED
jgi:hypothetical protein